MFDEEEQKLVKPPYDVTKVLYYKIYKKWRSPIFGSSLKVF
jgi:hypothetical protein